MTDPSLRSQSVDPDELAYYERLADRWWDAEGPFWPLHRLNGFRVGYIRRHLAAATGRDQELEHPLKGLRLLDIGCGGGILSESMARLGASVIGVDITEKSLRVARVHAQSSGLSITYRLASAEQLSAEGEVFDAVLNMEVSEHVENLQGFLQDCARLVRPGGLIFIATINRTLASFIMAILGAEYILRWLPRGTHRFRKFVKPEEAIRFLGGQFRLIDAIGVRVNPFTRTFGYTGWMGVNYMLTFERKVEI